MKVIGREAKAMTTVAMVTHTYDQTDQARASLTPGLNSLRAVCDP